MIIVTTLGLGRKKVDNSRYTYEEVSYRYRGDAGEERICTTSLFQAALQEWFPDANFVVLATEMSLKERRDDVTSALKNYEFAKIPDGRNEDEFWQIFDVIAASVPDGSQVILDITHGFRSIPMIGLLALSFLRVAKRNVDVVKILYGALDAKYDQPYAEVFDLRPFLTITDWANATHMFVKTGDARDLAPLMKAKRMYALNKVADAITDLSNAIASQRGGEILQSAEKLRVSIQEADQETLDVSHAPLELLLGRITAGFGPMAVAKPDQAPNEAILTAQLQQIKWLVQQRHYPAAYSLAREWLVSVRVAESQRRIMPIKKEDREEAEKWLNDREKTPDEKWTLVLKAWTAIGDFRNDLMHFGMRESPARYAKIEPTANELARQLRDAVAPLGLDLEPQEAAS